VVGKLIVIFTNLLLRFTKDVKITYILKNKTMNRRDKMTRVRNVICYKEDCEYWSKGSCDRLAIDLFIEDTVGCDTYKYRIHEKKG
jgi:hypothetical protein